VSAPDQTPEQIEERRRILAGYREMLDFLDAHPAVPVRASDPNNYYVLCDDDAQGMAELHAIAAALDVELTHNASRTHWYAVRPFGAVQYKAYHVSAEAMAEHHEAQAYARQRVAELRAADPEDGTS
jgi:hypothetical protein